MYWHRLQVPSEQRLRSAPAACPKNQETVDFLTHKSQPKRVSPLPELAPRRRLKKNVEDGVAALVTALLTLRLASTKICAQTQVLSVDAKPMLRTTTVK